MRWAMLTLFFFVFLTQPTPAADEDQAKAEAVLAKAIKAHGGEENLRKLELTTLELVGEAILDGKVIGFKDLVHRHGPDRIRRETEYSHAGEVNKTVRVMCGDIGWYSEGEIITDLGDADYAEEKDTAHTEWGALRLYPFREKGYRLTLLGEVEIDGKAAVGIKVTHKDHRDLGLYFDKGTTLLLKLEDEPKDMNHFPYKRVVRETFLSDYREVNNIQRAYKMTVKTGGELFLKQEVTGFKIVEKLDENKFAKPEK
jgi:hypothetical protein